MFSKATIAKSGANLMMDRAGWGICQRRYGIEADTFPKSLYITDNTYTYLFILKPITSTTVHV